MTGHSEQWISSLSSHLATNEHNTYRKERPSTYVERWSSTCARVGRFL